MDIPTISAYPSKLGKYLDRLRISFQFVREPRSIPCLYPYVQYPSLTSEDHTNYCLKLRYQHCMNDRSTFKTTPIDTHFLDRDTHSVVIPPDA